MREWNLVSGDPLQLTLAADVRFSNPDYLDDHIWELDLSGGDPGGLGLRTTYGLRARLMRIFPRFTENGKALSDPLAFAVPPSVRAFYPNFLTVSFAPYPGVEIIADYWVANSHAIAGRLNITNRSAVSHPINFEMVCQLIPQNGQSMTATLRKSVTTLQGQAEDLHPVLFLSGGPQNGSGPFASLSLLLDLATKSSRQISWALASTKDPQDSFELARKTAAHALDAEKARIELQNTGDMLEIFTGDPDWDAAFAFSQKAALSLPIGNSEHLLNTSFVLSRQPDQGYSRLGDGKDYQHFWDGQTSQDALYLSSLLPGASRFSEGFLKNFIAVQDPGNGVIDCKPGLAGQRGRYLAAPFLATLAWQLSLGGEDKNLVASIYPALYKFWKSWLDPIHDPDQNGLPEWQHLSQTGFEENPLFDGWQPWSKGVKISTVQTPALLAAFYHETQCLIKMSEILGNSDETSILSNQAEIICQAVRSCWNSDDKIYHYCDRDTHLSTPGKLICENPATSELNLERTFKQPVRLVIRVQSGEDTVKRPHVTITGKSFDRSQTEVLEPRDFIFSSNGTIATSEKTYTELGEFEFEGLNPQSQIIIQTADLTLIDQTLLLPIWANIPGQDEAQSFVYRTILNPKEFDHPFGISALPSESYPEAETLNYQVYLPWNQLIGEGLISYGFRLEAVRLISSIMAAVIKNLKQTQSFYHYYHAQSGAGIGERNMLHGFAPLGLFLKALGVEIQSPNRVILSGENLFPWPVTVKYRGLAVIRQKGETKIIFPNGQTQTMNDPVNAVVSCD